MQLNKDATIDIRVLSPEEQAFMRKHIALKFARGDTCTKISVDLNVQLHYVERVCRAVKLNGEESVALKRMGRPIGSNGVLNSEQEELIQKLLIETTPDVHGHQCFLWDNGSIKRLIKDKFCIE